MIVETFKRSFLKSLSYRVLGTLVTVLITYALTSKLEVAVTAGILDSVFKILLYFAHERLWTRIRYGKKIENGCVLWMTGLSGAGKTTLAKKIYDELKLKKNNVVWLDGDHIRKYFPNLGFSPAERIDHIKRVAMTASLLEQQGNIVIVSLISPYKIARDEARQMCRAFYEIYLAADLEVCKKRDVKGLYLKAENGELKQLTGVSDLYEAPVDPQLILETGTQTLQQSFDILKMFVKNLNNKSTAPEFFSDEKSKVERL